MRPIALLLALLVGAGATASGQAIATGAARGGDAALTFQYVHSNTQPGQCGCFAITGADLAMSRAMLTDHTAGVVDLSVGTAKNGPGTGNSLTLVSYLAGGRYYVSQTRFPKLQPFGQALAGIAHAGGGIAGAGDGKYALAARVGGGLDVPLSYALAVRLLQVDYFLTDFPNASNQHQNNYLIGAGVSIRFTRTSY